MEFKDGSSVYTSDGKEAGGLCRVVINPDTREVTHIVVQRGLLVKEEKVIEADKIASASQEQVTLYCTIDEFKEMPLLEIEQYAPMSQDYEQAQNYPSLTGGLYWNPALEHSIITEIKRTIEDELVALKGGAQVMSKDYDQVGNVECVVTDTETGKVILFIVSQGLMLKTRKSIPIQWVDMLGEDTIRLTVEARQLEDLRH